MTLLYVLLILKLVGIPGTELWPENIEEEANGRS